MLGFAIIAVLDLVLLKSAWKLYKEGDKKSMYLTFGFFGLLTSYALLLLDGGRSMGVITGSGIKQCSALNHLITGWVIPLLMVGQVVASAMYSVKELPKWWSVLIVVYAIMIFGASYGHCSREGKVFPSFAINHASMSRVTAMVYGVLFYVLFKFPNTSPDEQGNYFSSYVKKDWMRILIVAVLYFLIPAASYFYPIVFGIMLAMDMSKSEIQRFIADRAASTSQKLGVLPAGSSTPTAGVPATAASRVKPHYWYARAPVPAAAPVVASKSS